MSIAEPTLSAALLAAYAERDHWQRAAIGAEQVAAGAEADIATLRAELTASEASNAAIRRELETLRARTARLIAAEVASDPREPPVATCDCAERVEAAERRLAHARRMCHRLLDDAIDGRRR